MNRFGAYASEFQVAAVRSRWVIWFVAAIWIAFPFGLATLLHPGDAINLQYFLQGEGKHKVLSTQQMGVGFVETIFVLAFLLVVQFLGVLHFYRRARMDGARIATPALWPVAALLPGVLGNAIWFVCTGYLDTTGLLIGLVPTAITFFAERLMERLGRDFVLGPRVAGLH